MVGSFSLCPKLVNLSSSGGFHVTFKWLNLHSAYSMRKTSSLDAQLATQKIFYRFLKLNEIATTDINQLTVDSSQLMVNSRH